MATAEEVEQHQTNQWDLGYADGEAGEAPRFRDDDYVWGYAAARRAASRSSVAYGKRIGDKP